MKKKTERELYTPPQVQVDEIKARRIICQSWTGDPTGPEEDLFD